MKTYTVKEIAEMLQIDPETVRRWIRQGKLQAEQSSRKEGNVISEQRLQTFLAQTPKYAGMVTPWLKTSVGVTIAVASVLTGFAVQQHTNNAKAKSAQVGVVEVIRLLEKDIKTREENVSLKQKSIHQLQQEISLEEQYIADARAILEKIKEENQ